MSEEMSLEEAKSLFLRMYAVELEGALYAHS